MKKFLPGLVNLVCCLVVFLWSGPLVHASNSTGFAKPESGKERSCELVKTALAAKAQKLITKAEAFKAVFDKAATLNEKQVDTTLLQTRQTAVATAIAAAKSDVTKLACPTTQLRLTMEQVEIDLREVNMSLTNYRKTIKGLTGRPDKNLEPTSGPVLGAQIKRGVTTCSLSQVSAKKAIMTKIVTDAEKLEAKYKARSKTEGALVNAIVQSKRLSLDVALTKAKADITALTCIDGTTEEGVTTFKTDMQQALRALKAYRQALLDSKPDSAQTTLESTVTALPVLQ